MGSMEKTRVTVVGRVCLGVAMSWTRQGRSESADRKKKDKDKDSAWGNAQAWSESIEIYPFFVEGGWEWGGDAKC